MPLERLLQISIATLTVLGPLLLGMNDRFAALPLWVLIAAVSSLWLTDFTGWIRLNRTVSNLAAAAAVCLSLLEFWTLNSIIDIPSVAKLLVYLQVILLFQKKEFQIYLQLAVLSLLQVIVAAAFSQGFTFGLLLVAYLFVGLTTLVLLHLHREGNRDARRERPPAAPPPDGGRWPLAGQKPAFVSSQVGSESGLGIELWMRLATMSLICLLLTTVVFFATPRLGSGAWYGTSLVTRRMVGFSDEVTLGELGKVIEDPREVLVVKFLNEFNGEPYQVVGAVYLRGAVLTDYRDASWSSRSQSNVRSYQLSPMPTNSLAMVGMVRQEITLEPMDREELFCIWPFVVTQRDERIKLDNWRQRLIRPGYANTRFSFDLGTTAFADYVQKPIAPVIQAEMPIEPHRLARMPSREDFPTLTRLAEQTLAEAALPAEDHVGRAHALERMLRDSGDFEYSLEGQVRELGVDPIEDFIKTNRRGHCEYFATALALMLRSQGIPARVVVGFKSNEWNRLGNFCQVRQLHAHTWVEAYLEPSQIPPELFFADRPWQWENGAWLRLEPTPTARDLALEASDSIWGRMDSYLTWLDYLWTSYVMEMDSPRQREKIYTPLTELFNQIIAYLRNPESWKSFSRNIVAGLKSLLRGRWFDWRAGMAAMIAALALLLLCSGTRWLWRRFLRRFTGGVDSRHGHQSARVEFYHQLENILARFGLARAAWQTQREFAQEAEAEISRSNGREDLSALPGVVVDAFYRVRFGRLDLDSSQVEAVEEALVALSRAASKR